VLRLDCFLLLTHYLCPVLYSIRGGTR